MKKLLLACCILCLKISVAQLPAFYLDSIAYPSCSYSNDAIYFLAGKKMVKTDYAGHIIWGKENVCSRIVLRDRFIFGVSQDSIIRMDTSGAIIWVKKFASPFYTLFTKPNQFKNLEFDGSRLYIHEMQDPPGTWPYPPNQDFHPVVLVMDTLGNVLSMVCDSVVPGHGSFEPAASSRSLRRGSILSYGYIGGNYYYSYLQRIDTTGQFDLSANYPSIYFGDQNYVIKILPMPDSTYIILSWTNQSPSGSVVGFFTCTKVTESGTALWQYSYYDQSYTGPGYQSTNPSGITCDSANNIYITGTASNSNLYQGTFCTKLDPLGNVLLTKLWDKPASISHITGFTDIHYFNGNIYCLARYDSGYPAMIAFDSIFNNSCFPADTNITLNNVSQWIGTPNHYHSPSPILYNPVNQSLSLATRPCASLDLCGSLNRINEAGQSGALNLFPSPSTGKFKIENEELRIKSITIYNLLGENVMAVHLPTPNSPLPSEVDISSLPSGIYIVQINLGEKSWRGKVIKE